SQKGVKIDLIVRGICCLRPGVKGVSENIRVISIVGKLLEHSRIYYFKNGDNPRIFLSSADWRPRNLDRRVEVLFEVEQENIKNRLIKIINIYLSDNVKARELQSDGSYSIVNGEKQKQIESQIELYNFAKQNIRKINEDTRKNLFKY
ncbi:MAG: RNA degradosome polyphosphate kinase, partial [Candidatus Woesearchaeota archaeon]